MKNTGGYTQKAAGPYGGMSLSLQMLVWVFRTSNDGVTLRLYVCNKLGHQCQYIVWSDSNLLYLMLYF